MDPRDPRADPRLDPRAGPYRSPSPSHPLQQGYQLEPYGGQNQYDQHPSNLDMPPAPGYPHRFGTPDQVQMNAAVRILAP